MSLASPTAPRPRTATILALASCVAAAATAQPMARPAATDAPVELPPMMVEESVSSVPWLYVSAGGAEFLSRCSAATTRQFVETWLEKMRLLRTVVPDEFLGSSDVPSVFILYAQDLNHTVSAEIQRELQASDRPAPGDSPQASRVNIAPNMRLMDRDMHASIAYIDEALFESATMNISPNHLRYLVQNRVPEPPPWLLEGIERTWRAVDFVAAPITLRPLVWMDPQESSTLARDANRPRAVLPASELFAPAPARLAAAPHPRQLAARASTQELFVRWALVSGERTREALWRFAALASEGAGTPGAFEATFGFDFAELRDRLSDYLPKAVQQTVRLEPGKLPPAPRIEVERATPNQIARVRGEWERLAIGYVQRRVPQVREPYIAQARRTLRRAYTAGDRDPRLLATMGLCEIDAGNDAGARAFLEPAIALGVVRPRAYYELARLRLAELRARAPTAKTFSFTELAPTLEPLRRGMTQTPPLPEAVTLLAEAWACCDMPPNTAELAELEKGARLFATRPTVTYPIALAFARHGKTAEAAALLAASAAHAVDEPTRSDMTRLRGELAATETGGEGR